MDLRVSLMLIKVLGFIRSVVVVASVLSLLNAQLSMDTNNEQFFFVIAAKSSIHHFKLSKKSLMRRQEENPSLVRPDLFRSIYS